MTELAITILAVEDLRRSTEFYLAAFDWAIAVDAPSYVELASPRGVRVGLYQRDGFARNPGVAPAPIPADRVGPAELYFLTDDLDAAIDQMIRAGGRVLSPRAPRPWGDDAAYFADPDGHLLVLARPVQ